MLEASDGGASIGQTRRRLAASGPQYAPRTVLVIPRLEGLRVMAALGACVAPSSCSGYVVRPGSSCVQPRYGGSSARAPPGASSSAAATGRLATLSETCGTGR